MSSTLGLPLPPYDASITTNDFTTDNFAIFLSWKGQQDNNHYELSLNTTTETIFSNTTSLTLEGHYNIPLELTLVATNCAGNSRNISLKVHEGT